MPDAFGYTGIPSTLYAHAPDGSNYATLVWTGVWWEDAAVTLVLEEIHAAPRLRDYTTTSSASGAWSANDGTTTAYESYTVNSILYSVWQVAGSSGVPTCGGVGTPSNSGYITADSAYTWNFATVAADDSFLALDVHLFGNATVTGLTFNGDALTLIGVRSAAGDTHRVECWGLVNPDIGTYAVAVFLSAAVDSVTTAAQYENVQQTSPTGWFTSASATNSGTADNASVTVDCHTDGSVIHAACVSNDGAISAGQTSLNNVSGAGGSAVQEDTGTPVSPPTPTTMTCTGLGTTAVWAIGAYAIRPVGSANLPSMAVVFHYLKSMRDQD